MSIARKQQPLERSRFLDEVCAGDKQLRERLEALLRAHEHLGDSLAQPSPGIMAEVLADEESHTAESPLPERGLNDVSATSSAAPLNFNERYITDGELGRGGMGRVYVARDTKLGRRVAIKVLVPGGHDEDALRRFEQEARAAGSLNHPNVLTIYDIGMHEGEPYIVSELLEGNTLREQLDGNPLVVTKAIQYAAQLAEGLRAAHDKGVIHRDLKPANLFITDEGRLKILDFGIAKLVAPETASPEMRAPLETQTGSILGTMGYMSPEQVRGEHADHRSDIFSAGVILYEMLSGKRAFKADSWAETAHAILNHEPPGLPDQVPEGLEQLVRRCLKKKPEERFQSAHEMVLELRAIELQPREHRQISGQRKVDETEPVLEGASRAVLLGREAELAKLCGGLADARRSHGGIFLLRGEAGIGKTRLAQELAARAVSESGRVYWGRCYEGEGAPPFWPWIQVLRACVEGMRIADLRAAMGEGASYIAAIVPELKEKLRNLSSLPSSDSEASRFKLFEAVRTFLVRASRKRPIVLVFDDLHWADRASLLLLELAAQELPNMSVLVLGTYREGELSPPLAQTLGELARGHLQTMDLRGLNEADVGRLLAAASGSRPPEDLVRRVHGHTEGNPFFVTEVARLLGKSKAEFRIPESVKGALSRRLSHLSDLANQLLIAASVIGREFEFELLERTLVQSDQGELLHALEEALRALIIEPDPLGGERYQFRHALIKDALYDDLSPSRKARWHAQVAEALEEMLGANAGDRAPELAHHAARAGRLIASEKVVKYSTIAGQQLLAVHAYQEARPHFERAWKARQGLPLDAGGATILVGLGYAQAGTALRWNRQEAWANLRRVLDYQIKTGNIPEAVAIATHAGITPEGADDVAAAVERVLEMVPSASREEGWLRSRWGAATYFETGDYQRAQAAFERALTIAEAHGDVALELRTLAYATAVDHFAIRKQEVLSKSRRVIKLARRIDDLHAETYARYRAAYALMYGGSPDEARVEAEASLACAERLRDHGLLADALYANAALALLTGDWSAAREHIDRGLALSPHQLALLHARMLLEYETGNSDAGNDYLRRIVEADRRAGPYPLAGIFVAVGTADSVRLENSPPATTISTARALLKRTSHIAEVETVTKIGRALFAIQERNGSECAKALEQLVPFKGLILWPPLVIDRICGLLAQAAGLAGRAATEFESALNFYRRAGYRPELGWTCYDYARLLLESDGRDDREKASTLLAEARGIASELGMRPLASLVTNFQERYSSRRIDHSGRTS